MGGLYVGVDGGGSTCRVRVRDGLGRLRGAATGGAANAYLDFENAIETTRATVAEALAMAGREPDQPLCLGVGLAGVSSPAVATRVRAALDTGQGGVTVASDAAVACLGAHAGQDGGLVIAGTGSGAVARLDGAFLALGGRGFILGDDGSGARLGQEALRAALRAADGLGPASALTDALLARFGHDIPAVIAWGRQARSSDFAGLAPAVVEAAGRADPVATALVTEAVAALGRLAAALLDRGVPRLSFVGGLSTVLLPFVPPALQARFALPLHDALEGALLLAGLPASRLGHP